MPGVGIDNLVPQALLHRLKIPKLALQHRKRGFIDHDSSLPKVLQFMPIGKAGHWYRVLPVPLTEGGRSVRKERLGKVLRIEPVNPFRFGTGALQKRHEVFA